MAARFSLSFPVLLSAVPMYVAVPRRDMLRAGDADHKAAIRGAQGLLLGRRNYVELPGAPVRCAVPAVPDLRHQPLPAAAGQRYARVPVGRARPGTRSVGDSRCCRLDDTAAVSLWPSSRRCSTGATACSAACRATASASCTSVCPPEAGGLHLGMKPPVIKMLAKPRQFKPPRNCASTSRSRAATGEPNAWERHRWTRARTTLSALRVYCGDIRKAPSDRRPRLRPPPAYFDAAPTIHSRATRRGNRRWNWRKAPAR